MFHIKSVPELLRGIEVIKGELNEIKKDIEDIQKITVNDAKKIMGFFSAFVTTSNTTMGAKKEYENIYTAINKGDSNIVETIDSLITKLNTEEQLLNSLLDPKKKELNEREALAIKNFEDMAKEWERLRGLIGKIDNISLNFIYGATKIDDVVELGKALLRDIESINNNDVKLDFKGFIIDAIKGDLKNDTEFFEDSNHNWRRNFYEFVYPIFLQTIKRCFENPVAAVPEAEFVDFVKSGTYRRVPQLGELSHPAKNNKFVENSIYNIFRRKYSGVGFSGGNLDDFISWLHSATSGGGSGSGGGGGGGSSYTVHPGVNGSADNINVVLKFENMAGVPIAGTMVAFGSQRGPTNSLGEVRFDMSRDTAIGTPISARVLVDFALSVGGRGIAGTVELIPGQNYYVIKLA